MNYDLIEKAHSIKKDAQSRGVSGVRVLVYRNSETEVLLRNGKLDRVHESTHRGINIVLFVNGRYSSNTTSDLRPIALSRFLDQTIAMTRALTLDPHRVLPSPECYKNPCNKELRLFDQQGWQSITLDKQKRFAKKLEQAARSAQGAERIISVTTNCSAAKSESAMVTSNGMEGTHRSSIFVLGAETSVRGKKECKPEGSWYTARRYTSKLPAEEFIGREATRRACAHIGARPEKSGKYACVVENCVAGELVSDLISPLRGSSIQQQRSWLARKLGERIASSVLSMYDDPHVVEGLGSCTYDAEGMVTRARPIFERGKLENFYLDTYYASKLNKKPTTGTVTNLVFIKGTQNLFELVKTMDKGILITDFCGGNSNTATGDFSLGIRGAWIQNGQIVRPISEMNLSGNHSQFWNNLVEVGCDSYVDSCIRVPSLCFEDVQFSGV